MKYHNLDIDELCSFEKKIFEACGLSVEDSRRAANVLMHADLRGLDSHGVINLGQIYVPKLLNGEINISPRFRNVVDTSSICVMDGDNGLGLLTAQIAMDIAIEKAREAGCGIVCVRNSTHFGSAGYYAMQATTENMIGIAMTNTGNKGLIRPPGGVQKLIGTNPISIAAPTRDVPPFLLDMSTAVASEGKVRITRMKEELVPGGWVVDQSGIPINDFTYNLEQDYFLQFLGSQMNTAVFKGFGLAIAVEMFCGLLSGAGVGPECISLADSNRSQNIGHFLMAIDIGKFIDPKLFQDRLDDMLKTLVNSIRYKEDQGISYPGWNGESVAKNRSRFGIPVCDQVYRSMGQLSQKFTIPLPKPQ